SGRRCSRCPSGDADSSAPRIRANARATAPRATSPTCAPRAAASCTGTASTPATDGSLRGRAEAGDSSRGPLVAHYLLRAFTTPGCYQEARVAVEVHGMVEPRFAAVRDAFATNFPHHGDVGAVCAVSSNAKRRGGYQTTGRSYSRPPERATSC